MMHFFTTTKHVKKIHACRDINTKIIKHGNTKMIISKYCVMLFFSCAAINACMFIQALEQMWWSWFQHQSFSDLTKGGQTLQYEQNKFKSMRKSCMGGSSDRRTWQQCFEGYISAMELYFPVKWNAMTCWQSRLPLKAVAPSDIIQLKELYNVGNIMYVLFS